MCIKEAGARHFKAGTCFSGVHGSKYAQVSYRDVLMAVCFTLVRMLSVTFIHFKPTQQLDQPTSSPDAQLHMTRG